jgi:ABC-type dipeptide/oligopeptide/nickel transport system permease component
VTRYIVRRMLIAVPVLLSITLIVFIMLHSAGGDPAVVMLGARASDASLAALRSELGLDEPLPMQYVDFVRGAVQGNFGTSYRSQQPVAHEIFSRFPATVELAFGAMFIATIIGLIAGTVAATRKNSFFDYSSTVMSLIGVSVPTFWLGIILIIIFGVELKWLPISGRVDPRIGADPNAHFLIINSFVHGNWAVFWDALKHLILPAFTLAAWPAAIIARMTRASLLESMGQDYIRTARAKGLKERNIIVRHVFRNAMLPIITVAGIEFGGLLAGAVVTEQVFSWPGIGKLTVDAITNRDYQIVQGVVILVGVIFILMNLVVDIVYVWLDPRIRYG